MRATCAVAALCCALLLVACGTSSRKKHVQGPAKQVADTVNALQHDLITRNWGDICEQVFSAQARAQAGGDGCPEYVRRGAAGLRAERIRVRSIDVRAGKASADVTTSAEGQAPVRETIDLVLENGRYRVSALAR
jgi:hypothetical protein